MPLILYWKTLRKFRSAARSLYSGTPRARGAQVGQGYDSTHALSGIEQGPGVLLKSRYLRRSFMATGSGFAGKRLSLALAFGVLVSAAIGAGCKGFFPNPTLSTVAVQPPT